MAVFKSLLHGLRVFSSLKQTQSEVPSGGGQKWDVIAIDAVYEDLLDRIGLVLDKVQVQGLRPLLGKKSPIKYLLGLLEQMETELLIQWKLRREKDLAAVFDRQKKWLSMEMRSQEGFFPNWNRYYRGLLETLKDATSLVHRDPWRSLVLVTLMDAEVMSQLLPVVSTHRKDKLAKEICGLFEMLFNISPYRLAISFLNLIELGTGERPEIADTGDVSSPSGGHQISSSARHLLSQVIDHNDWTDMPKRLLEFWQNSKMKLN